MKHIFSICITVALGFLASCDGSPNREMPYNQGINVIPVPLSLVETDGVFTLRPNTVLYAPTDSIKTIAEFFASKIGLSTGYALTVTSKEKSDNAISLLIDKTIPAGAEGYMLESSPTGIMIKGKTAQGIFYGMQTLMQLFPAEIESSELITKIAWTVPAVIIQDEPRFPYRGVMLDPCRHFIPVENVKKQLDVMAMFKINTMHFHLTDDQGWRIEIKKYPKLTGIGSRRIEGEGNEYGGFYTQDDIREIVTYATERFITVIPEIELPGHGLAAISAYPGLSCTGNSVSPRIIWGVEDIVFCAGKEETFDFLEDVFDEVVPLFPGTYIHIGGDECPKTSWEACPLCQKRIQDEKLNIPGQVSADGKKHSNEEHLQSYFVQRMEKYLAQKHKRKIIGWDEILEGGLAPSATVMSWRGEEGGIAAADMNHDVIMTPQNDGMYLDRFEGDSKIEPVTIGGYASLEDVYNYNPVPASLAADKRHFIRGAQCNNWSEYMYTTDLMEYRMYPRLLAVAELTWSADTRKDYKDFERRIDNALVRLDLHEINYHIPQPEQPGGSLDFVAFTDSTLLAFKTSRPIKMVYTTDDSEPIQNSPVYETPIGFTESGKLKIRSVLPSGKMSRTRTITVEKQTLSPSIEAVETKPGLNLQYTFGRFLTAKELESTSNWKESSIKNLREMTREKVNESTGKAEPFGAVASGYIYIPEDGVYIFSSDNEQVWIDDKLLVDNAGQTKRFSRHDVSIALSKGLHKFKTVFIDQIIGGWPTVWNDGSVKLRKIDSDKFVSISEEMLFY